MKSPVKIQNFQKPANDVLLNRFTKIKPIEKSEIDFNRADICNSEGVVPNIASIQNVAGEQVISLNGEIALSKKWQHLHLGTEPKTVGSSPIQSLEKGQHRHLRTETKT